MPSDKRRGLTPTRLHLRLEEGGLGSLPMFEDGLFTLAKIIGTLVFCMGVVPLLFLTARGTDTSEPEDVFDTD